jgi:hypothetical protein
MPTIQRTRASESKTNTITGTALAITHVSWSWTANEVESSEKATVSVNRGDVNIMYDGTAPTATTGFRLPHGSIATFEGRDIQNLQFIKISNDDALLTITLERF